MRKTKTKVLGQAGGMLWSIRPGDLVLDPFVGSSTTAVK